MEVYRRSFLPYTDGDTKRAATLFQMLERFLVPKKKKVNTFTGGFRLVRTVRYFDLEESIAIASERVETMTNLRWIQHWIDLLSTLAAIKSNYVEEYSIAEVAIRIPTSEKVLHLRQNRAAKNRIYKAYRQDLFRMKWNNLIW